MKTVDKVFSAMDFIAKFICCGCALGFFGIIIYQVIARTFLHLSCNWTDETCRYLFFLMVYSGAVLCVNENGHFSIDVVEVLLPQKVRDVLRFIVHVVSMTFLYFMAKSGVVLMTKAGRQLSTSLRIPMGRLYVVFPISAILMILYTLRVAVGDYIRIRNEWKREGVPTEVDS